MMTLATHASALNAGSNIAAIVIGTGAILMGLKRALKVLRRLADAVDKVEGRSRQLEPNSGSHMRDDVAEIRATVNRLDTAQTVMQSTVIEVRDRLDAHLEAHVNAGMVLIPDRRHRPDPQT